jgi:cob(I)alamin adenosyltransferase
MSISTRTGDAGETALAFNRRVSKTHPRVCAYGTVDELSSVIGLSRGLLNTHIGDLLSFIEESGEATTLFGESADADDFDLEEERAESGRRLESLRHLDQRLRSFQAVLLRLGADLAVDDADRPKMGERYKPLGSEDLAALDAPRSSNWRIKVPPLREFVLPGDDPISAHMHHARTVCRRAEREVIRVLESGQSVAPLNIQYLNRPPTSSGSCPLRVSGTCEA